MWDDEAREVLMAHDQGADSSHTLSELMLPNKHDDEDSGSELNMQGFVEEDEKIVELLVASSLLNLNASAWLRADLSIKSIRLESSPNSRRRWKPLVACSLKAIDTHDEIHDAILSFGLLLMEMEGKKTVRPQRMDKRWETGLTCKESMLRRTIESLNRVVSDGYRRIATACVRFKDLSARLHDPGLTQELRQRAAIYKYILAPLHRLAIHEHSRISPMFSDFPSSLRSTSGTQHGSLNQATSSPSLLLFDSVDTHDPT